MDSLQIISVLLLILSAFGFAVSVTFLITRARHIHSLLRQTHLEAVESLTQSKEIAKKMQDVNNSLVTQVAEHHRRLEEMKMILDLSKKR